MASLQILLFNVLLLMNLSKTHGKRDFNFVLDTCSLTCNPSYVDVCYCRINKTFNPPRGTLYLHMIRQADEFKFSFEVSLWKKNNEKYNLINSTNNDGCAFLKGNNIPTLVNIFKEHLAKFGALPKGCPLKKDVEYVYKDFTVDAERFPPYVPEARYTIRAVFTVGGEEFISGVGFSDVVHTGSSKRMRIL